MKLRPPIKNHGGKFYLASWIIEHFPSNYEELTYCEPFCGGASVFLNKKKSQREIISDLNYGIMCIFRALNHDPIKFISKLRTIEYSKDTFIRALEESKEINDYIDKAVNEYILRRMSRGGMKKTFAWSERKRGGNPGDLNAWNTMLEELPLTAERVKSNFIFHADFRGTFKTWDEEDSLTYLDPPYLSSTRSKNSREVYDREMSEKDHVDMLCMVNNAKGKVIISGYASSMYNELLDGWKCERKEIANHSSQAKTKSRRIECLWMNY